MIRAVLFDYGRVLYGPLLPQRQLTRLAKQLRDEGVKTGILSNVFPAAAWAVRLIGGYRGFNPVILSYKVKSAKPDATIYQIAIKQLNLPSNEVLFIDNRLENIQAAKRVGMQTVHARETRQVVSDIKTILLKENGLKL
jgi:putative hydrolase of the HAD superfamily